MCVQRSEALSLNSSPVVRCSEFAYGSIDLNGNYCFTECSEWNTLENNVTLPNYRFTYFRWFQGLHYSVTYALANPIDKFQYEDRTVVFVIILCEKDIPDISSYALSFSTSFPEIRLLSIWIRCKLVENRTIDFHMTLGMDAKWRLDVLIDKWEWHRRRPI